MRIGWRPLRLLYFSHRPPSPRGLGAVSPFRSVHAEPPAAARTHLRPTGRGAEGLKLGTLPSTFSVLFCSPFPELGLDLGNLRRAEWARSRSTLPPPYRDSYWMGEVIEGVLRALSNLETGSCFKYGVEARKKSGTKRGQTGESSGLGR